MLTFSDSLVYSFSLRSLSFIEDVILIPSNRLSLLVHDFALIHQNHVLLLILVVVYLSRKLLDERVFTTKDCRSRPVSYLCTKGSNFIRSSPSVASKNTLTINLNFKLVHTSLRSFCIVPKSYNAESNWFLKHEDYEIWLTNLCLLIIFDRSIYRS